MGVEANLKPGHRRVELREACVSFIIIYWRWLVIKKSTATTFNSIQPESRASICNCPANINDHTLQSFIL